MLARGGGAESSSAAGGKPVALVRGAVGAGATTGGAGIVLVAARGEVEVDMVLVLVPSSEVGGVVTTPGVVAPAAPPAPLPTLSRLDPSLSFCGHVPPSRSTHVRANFSLSLSFPGQLSRIWTRAARMAFTAVSFCWVVSAGGTPRRDDTSVVRPRRMER